MPELPEVERAVRALRPAVTGRSIARVRTHHPAYARRLGRRGCAALVGAVVAGITRHGKEQRIHLFDGRTLLVHFRMTGDWDVGKSADPLPRFARCSIDFTDGTRAVLSDPRALGTVELRAANARVEATLGPEPTDAALTPVALRAALAGRRTSIKAALLDQRVIAGLGNIYVAESLWEARIDPRTIARTLTLAQVTVLLRSIQRVIERATGARYGERGASRLAVYDREGAPCRRCGNGIARITQAGRSTYFCPVCQRPATEPEGVPL